MFRNKICKKINLYHCLPNVYPKIKKPSQIIDLQGFKWVVGDSAGIRTQDHYIKSVMLYQLSYGINKRNKEKGNRRGLKLVQFHQLREQFPYSVKNDLFVAIKSTHLFKKSGKDRIKKP